MIFHRISGIRPDIWNQAGYPESGQISGIRPDIRNPAGQWVSGIRQDIWCIPIWGFYTYWDFDLLSHQNVLLHMQWCIMHCILLNSTLWSPFSCLAPTAASSCCHLPGDSFITSENYTKVAMTNAAVAAVASFDSCCDLPCDSFTKSCNAKCSSGSSC